MYEYRRSFKSGNRGSLESGTRESPESGSRVCKTPDFHRKPESLYLRDSPWISGYRVQNISQINTQSLTSYHIRVKVHNLLHVHYGVHHYKPLG
jgi:hypothetical protein